MGEKGKAGDIIDRENLGRVGLFVWEWRGGMDGVRVGMLEFMLDHGFVATLGCLL